MMEVEGETPASVPPASVSHLTEALREAAAEPGATLRYPTPEGVSDEQAFRGPPGVPLTPANPAADPASHRLIVAPGPSPGQVDVVEQVDVIAPGKGGKELAEALLRAREKAPAAQLHGDQPLRDPQATHGSSDEGEGPAAAETAGVTPSGESASSPLLPGGPTSAAEEVPSPPAAASTETGGGGTLASVPPASVSHLAEALREAAAEPGATLRYPTPEGVSDEQAFRGPPGVPLTPANPAADPASHRLIVAPGPSPGQVDVVEQVDLPPLAKDDGSPVPEAAAVLEQVCERHPAIGPKPLHDPLADTGSSYEGEGREGGAEEKGAAQSAMAALGRPSGDEGEGGGEGGGQAVEDATCKTPRGAAERNLTAAMAALGRPSRDEGEGGGEAAGGGQEAESSPPETTASPGVVDALTAAMAAVGLESPLRDLGAAAGEEEEAAGGDVTGEGRGRGEGGHGGGRVSSAVAAAADKLRHTAGGVVDAVRGSAGQVDQAARQLAAALTVGAALARDKVLGGTSGASKAEEVTGEPLVGDIIGGGGARDRDQTDITADWTSGPAP